MMKHRSRAGLSMIEVVIASAILIVVIAMAFGMLVTATNSTSNQQSITSVEQRLQDTLTLIASDLRNSGGTYTLATPTQNGDAYYDSSLVGLAAYHTDLTFGVNSGFDVATSGKNATGSANYTDLTVRYYWKLDPEEALVFNNVDDDRDGWIDEGVVVRWERRISRDPTDRTVIQSDLTSESIVCRDVPRRALTFQFPSNDNPPKAVAINLQIMAQDLTQGRDANGRAKTMIRQATRIAGPRN